MSKTIATTIKADVVIYQDGSVEVVTDAATHASGTPAVVKLNEWGALHCRRVFTADELAGYGLALYGLTDANSLAYDRGERAGYEWAIEMLHRGELDRVADLQFDRDARRQQAGWCTNSDGILDNPTPYYNAVNGWMNGFNLAVCEAFATVPEWSGVYDRHKRLNETRSEVEMMY